MSAPTPEHAPVTIQQISRQMGLSVSTISKALNNYGDVSDATKKRVRETAAALGYAPSAAARNLRRQRTEKIGFSYGFRSSYIGEFAARIINGAVAIAEQEGYNITLYPLSEERVPNLLRISRTREVDGWLMMGGDHWQEAVSVLQGENIPFVVLNRHVPDPRVSFVAVDEVQAGAMATEHLLALGHRRIGIITRSVLEMGEARITGYRAALARGDCEFESNLVVGTELTQGTAYEAMGRLLDLPDPPTAVIGVNDIVAVECLQAIVDHGLSVPDDIAVIGSDDLRESLTANPPLTTLHPPLTEMGRLAVSGLLRQLANPASPPMRHSLPATLVIRQST